MDFAQFNTKDGAEEGRFLHLRHVKTRDLMYDSDAEGDDKRVGIWVRGMESASVKSAARAVMRDGMTAENTPDENDPRVTAALVVKFQNITRDGKPLTTSKDDVRWFFGLSDALAGQVNQFSANSGNFVSVASSD